MNPDAILLALLAIADFALIVHLRQRHAKRVRMDRMMASLRMAVRRENGVELLPAKRRVFADQLADPVGASLHHQA